MANARKTSRASRSTGSEPSPASYQSPMSKAIDAAVGSVGQTANDLATHNRALAIDRSLDSVGQHMDPALVEQILKALDAVQNNPLLKESQEAARQTAAAMEHAFLGGEQLQATRSAVLARLNDPHLLEQLKTARRAFETMEQALPLQAARKATQTLPAPLDLPLPLENTPALVKPAKRDRFRTISSVEEIGARVREVRHAMGMTQQRFADLAGVGRRFLVELEHGKPSLEIGKVLAVCRAAGISIGFNA